MQKGRKGKSGVFGAWVLEKTSAQKKAFFGKQWAFKAEKWLIRLNKG
jgi:hypothetical protein